MTTPRESAPAARRALLIFAGAMALRAVYLLFILRTACLDINLDPISDMEAFHRWALTIVDGDWLGRGDFHPFHPWQASVASRDEWAAWYGHVFHQEPFYPYLIALIYLVSPHQPLSVIVAQMLLGAAGCALTYLAARRLLVEGAALAAGILAALYGPYLYYESLMLRDSLLIPMSALMLWLLGEARARTGPRHAWWWCALGLSAGVIYVTKASIVAFLVLLAVWWMLEWRSGRDARERWMPALVAAGFSVALLPVAARNLAVGAPVMKITTRGPIEFINGNNPWHRGIGWFDGDDRRVSQYAHDTLQRSGGRLVPTALYVLRDWSEHPLALIRLQAVKTAYFFAPFEMPNNASYSYFRLNSLLLRRFTLSFFWIAPLALVGLIESARRWRDFVPLYLFLVAGTGITVVFYVIARFRAPLMPAILILAGLGLHALVEHARRRSWARLGVCGAVLGLALAVNAASSFRDRDLVRPQDHLISIDGYRSRGRFGDAISEAEAGRRAFPTFAIFHKIAASLYESQGRLDEAAGALREAVARDPSDTEARRDLMRLEGRKPP